MAKKSKLSKDAFDWVKNTSPEAEGSPPPEVKEEAAPSEVKREAKALRGITTKERTIFVKHKKRGGEIMSIAETIAGQDEITAHPFFNVPADEDVKEFNLADDLLAKELIEIHTKYKVDTAGKAPKLVLKR